MGGQTESFSDPTGMGDNGDTDTSRRERGNFGGEDTVARDEDELVKSGRDVLVKNCKKCTVRAIGARTDEVAQVGPGGADGQESNVANADHNLVWCLDIERSANLHPRPSGCVLVQDRPANDVLDVDQHEPASSQALVYRVCGVPV